MSKNNTIKKSDKKFIRKEKARIRAQFFDLKKQEEMISQLYSRFLQAPDLNNEPVVRHDVNAKSQITISLPTEQAGKSQTNSKSKIQKTKSVKSNK